MNYKETFEDLLEKINNFDFPMGSEFVKPLKAEYQYFEDGDWLIMKCIIGTQEKGIYMDVLRVNRNERTEEDLFKMHYYTVLRFMIGSSFFRTK